MVHIINYIQVDARAQDSQQEFGQSITPALRNGEGTVLLFEFCFNTMAMYEKYPKSNLNKLRFILSQIHASNALRKMYYHLGWKEFYPQSPAHSLSHLRFICGQLIVILNVHLVKVIIVVVWLHLSGVSRRRSQNHIQDQESQN